MIGSVPGLLDSISCSSNADIPAAVMEEEAAVPNILTECFRHLERHGLHTLGLFRVSTSKKRIRQLREDFDCGKESSLEDEQCPHDVATLLKEYLRDLPDPLLCRDLYHAFVQTQRIRNRRLQLEALQHLVQLLPSANRDTLYALLSFLAVVAKYADDSQNDSGEVVSGNKMDTSNLATVFAPNILHCIKPGAKDISDRPEDRIDIINVVRTLIDHYKSIFTISAELLDEVYLHMMDTNAEELEVLLNKKDGSAAADESVDELDSESNSAPWTPVTLAHDPPLDSIFDSKLAEQKKTYSREEFLHEAAATGGPNVGMRISTGELVMFMKKHLKLFLAFLILQEIVEKVAAAVEAKFEERLSAQRNEIESLRCISQELQKDNLVLRKILDSQEQSLRNMNVRILGIKAENGEDLRSKRRSRQYLKIFKKLATFNYRKTYNELIAFYKEPTITGFIKPKRIRWLGPKERMAVKRLPKPVITRKLIGPKIRGRPRTRRINKVEEDLKHVKVKDWK
uniref:Unconventional myosin-IXa-like n=1 Tax=Diabrotica virgifera virgifera TaxID=50390 RepID=A0A6P7GCF2_DIAVI